MNNVKIIGGAMTKIGRHFDRDLKSLVEEAVCAALKEAGIEKSQLQGAWVGNASQGVLQGQESIRGQVVLRNMGIGGIPVINVENACASSATAIYGARSMVALGEADVVLALGMEKMFAKDRTKALLAYQGCMDVSMMEESLKKMADKTEELKEILRNQDKAEKKESGQRSVFMDAYAYLACLHMKKYGLTQRQLAVISSKNHFHSTMNPLAQYQIPLSVDEVLNAPEVAWPLTTPMCSPIGDGVAAVVICSDEFAKKLGKQKPIEIAACVLASGEDDKNEEKGGTLGELAVAAYRKAGLGPEDIDLAEVHDATAFGEANATEKLGFCPLGEGGAFAEAGHSTLGGKLPVNVSGGLESQGHPIGATGARQVVELYWHLMDDGRTGNRQVKGAMVGLAQNAGGKIGEGEGALSVTILKR